MGRDYDWLFRQNRFTGADRLGDTDQLAIAITNRIIDSSSGRERLQLSIGQIQYFEDRIVGLNSDDPPEISSNSGLIAQGKFNFSSHWSLRGGVQLDPENSGLLQAGFDLNFNDTPHHLVNFAYLLDQDRSFLNPGEQIQSTDISLLWPLNSHWRLLGRWNRALNLELNLEALAGIEYESCCLAVRTAVRQYRNSPVDAEPQTTFYIEVALKGLSQIGSSLENQLQTSILGYQPLH
jgi:LPS-assembly protein